jgi:capsular exopolysaccharide synthesis family protein
MSRLRSLLQKAQWLEEKASLQQPDARPGSVYGDAPAALSELPADHIVLKPGARLVYHTELHSAAADRYRLLRFRLQALWSTGQLRRLLVTSPLPGDGKSTVVMNLATAVSERGKRTVLVVEADLHHSPLAHNLGVHPKIGLAECLEGSCDPLSAIRRLDPLGWYLLPAGTVSGNPTELLQGPLLPELLDEVANHFDWVVIDSPPVIPLSEVLSLKSHSDRSLLVVRASRTSQAAVEEAVALLGKQHVVGIVLNGVEEPDLLYHKYPDPNFSGSSSAGDK